LRFFRLTRRIAQPVFCDAAAAIFGALSLQAAIAPW
jgi:hypothetical protein